MCVAERKSGVGVSGRRAARADVFLASALGSDGSRASRELEGGQCGVQQLGLARSQGGVPATNNLPGIWRCGCALQPGKPICVCQGVCWSCPVCLSYDV